MRPMLVYFVYYENHRRERGISIASRPGKIFHSVSSSSIRHSYRIASRLSIYGMYCIIHTRACTRRKPSSRHVGRRKYISVPLLRPFFLPVRVPVYSPLRPLRFLADPRQKPASCWRNGITEFYLQNGTHTTRSRTIASPSRSPSTLSPPATTQLTASSRLF